MNDKNTDPVDRLVDAYEAMLERVHQSAEGVEKQSLSWLRETLAEVRDRTVELGELTREEADKISRYVERDLKDAATFVAETGQELRDWLQFDWRLLQDRMLGMFVGMADQTALTLRNIADQAREATHYHTGEIVAPGTLVCAGCGEVLHFRKTGRIPPCPKCHASSFRRESNTESEPSE